MNLKPSHHFIENRIKELGFRMTPQRQLILEAIERSGEHATLEEIFNQARELAPQISRTTIYRTLAMFSRYRLIHGNEISGGKVYELVAEERHHHLFCHRCWADIRIEEDQFSDFKEKMDQEYGFLVLAEHHIFMGLCSNCRKKYGDTLGQFSIHPKFIQDALKEEQKA